MRPRCDDDRIGVAGIFDVPREDVGYEDLFADDIRRGDRPLDERYPAEVVDGRRVLDACQTRRGSRDDVIVVKRGLETGQASAGEDDIRAMCDRAADVRDSSGGRRRSRHQIDFGEAVVFDIVQRVDATSSVDTTSQGAGSREEERVVGSSADEVFDVLEALSVQVAGIRTNNLPDRNLVLTDESIVAWSAFILVASRTGHQAIVTSRADEEVVGRVADEKVIT